jgi:predicted nucleic acid-binding protein
MSGRLFLDTNVLVYAFDDADRRKQERAWGILNAVGQDGTGMLSTQVLQEFYVTVTRKLDRPLDEETAERVVGALTALPVVQIDPSMVQAAIRTSRAHQLSLWDALILQAAMASGCKELYTEDLQEGFQVGGVRVVDPFGE